MQLAIDTSTETASLALVQGSEVLAESTWHCGQNHTAQLLPHLVELLNQAKSSPASISAIIVAIGPGSFNGLRAGLSTAKGLALSLRVPIVGISSLEVEAYLHAKTGLPICPIFHVGGEEVAAALFQMDDNGWHKLLAEQITTVDQLASQIATKTIFCGRFALTIATRLRKQLRRRAVVLPSAPESGHARLLAELGLKRLESGSGDNLATLQPLYLRRPHITERRHL